MRVVFKVHRTREHKCKPRKKRNSKKPQTLLTYCTHSYAWDFNFLLPLRDYHIALCICINKNFKGKAWKNHEIKLWNIQMQILRV